MSVKKFIAYQNDLFDSMINYLNIITQSQQFTYCELSIITQPQQFKYYELSIITKPQQYKYCELSIITQPQPFTYCKFSTLANRKGMSRLLKTIRKNAINLQLILSKTNLLR